MSKLTVAKTLPRCTLICMLILVALWGIPPMQAHADNEAVSVWLTTPADPADPTNLTKLSNKLTQQPDVYLAQDSGSNPTTIGVNENTTYQQVDGFGGTVTDSSAWLLRTKLSSSTRASVMANLFGSSGIGLNFLRQPFGATDFITSSAIGAQDLFYTFDDIPTGQTDYPLAHFSVGYDQNWMIPVLQQAIQNNPSLEILATAWSAPAWMKDNGSLVGGNLNANAYDAYAQYFVKSIQAYQGQGIPIYAITPLNEPGVNVPYNSMNFTAANEGAFIKNNLVPALNSANLHPRILIYDWNYGDAQVGTSNDYPDAILNDSTVSPFVAGTAFHCYDGDPGVMTTVHNNHPDKDVYMDECSPGSPSGCFYPNTYPVNEVIDTMRNWSRSTVTWNVALDSNGGPFHNNGGQTACTPLVIVNPDGTVTYTHNYYELGQVSKFVTRGAYRIDSNQAGPINDVAFKNPDGSKVLLVHNTDLSHTQVFKVRWGTESFTYALPGNGIATFKWSGTPSTTYGWGNSAYGTDSGNIYGGGASNPSEWSVIDASSANSIALGAGFHSLYRGNPAVTSYIVSAQVQLVATGTTKPYPKYGLYAGYHDENNYVQAWIDPGPCFCFVTHAVVGGADQGWMNYNLPNGVTPTAYNIIKVIRSGASWKFYLNDIPIGPNAASWDIDHGQNDSGQVGLVTQDAQANFRNVTVF